MPHTIRPQSARFVPAAMLLLTLTGCNGAGEGADPGTPDATASVTDSSSIGESSTPPSGSPIESPTADVTVPEEVAVTAQGSDLAFGDSATVVFEPDRKRESVLQLTVTKARKGSLDDFDGFILDSDYKKKANYFYVRVKVKNVGEGNVGGADVPLWGVNQDNTLLPAVNFKTRFPPCSSKPLPKKFKPGERFKTCLVYLSPDAGKLAAVSFRPDQAFDPIEWTGDVKLPKKPQKDQRRGRNRR